MLDGAFIVTGAGSGIGRAVARLLIERRASVVIADVDGDGLAKTREASGGADAQVALCHLDVRDPASWQGAVDVGRERFGAIRGLVNVAGVIMPQRAWSLTRDAIDRTLDVNVKGVIFGVAAVTPALLERGRGTIVNVASMAGIAAVPGNAVYAASKHAVRGFSLSIAEELRPKGTRVTVVCPSLVSTPMMDAISGCEGVGPTFAVRRPLTPEEVARAVVERGIDRGELEVVLSAPGSFQGPLAKLANAFPRTNAWGMPLIEARGERRRRALAQSGAE